MDRTTAFIGLSALLALFALFVIGVVLLVTGV